MEFYLRTRISKVRIPNSTSGHQAMEFPNRLRIYGLANWRTSILTNWLTGGTADGKLANLRTCGLTSKEEEEEEEEEEKEKKEDAEEGRLADCQTGGLADGRPAGLAGWRTKKKKKTES